MNVTDFIRQWIRYLCIIYDLCDHKKLGGKDLYVFTREYTHVWRWNTPQEISVATSLSLYIHTAEKGCFTKLFNCWIIVTEKCLKKWKFNFHSFLRPAILRRTSNVSIDLLLMLIKKPQIDMGLNEMLDNLWLISSTFLTLNEERF